jgi:hypothetical protein
MDNPEEEMRPIKEIHQKIPASIISASESKDSKESNIETADDIGGRDEEIRNNYSDSGREFKAILS